MAEPFDTCLHGTCLAIEDHGSDRYAGVDLGYGTVVTRLPEDRRSPGRGNPVELAVEVNRLHFFDPETGAAL